MTAELIDVDTTDERQRRGAARLFGTKPHTLTVWAMQNGGRLDYDRLPRRWLEHAIGVLEKIQVEHGAMAMVDVLEMLADEPPETPRRRRRSRR